MPKPQPPEGYFDATTLLKDLKPPKYVKVSQFLDSQEVKELVGEIEARPEEVRITREGCYGYTWLHNDLRVLFDKWLKFVGTGRGKRTTL